jgi:mono/diheme cytochrome c family protein
MPKWLVPGFIALVIVSFIPAAMISWSRATHQDRPRINLIPDMDYQPKFLPQTENALFVDGRSMRPQPEGTIARGQLRADGVFWRGQADDGSFVSGIPASAMQAHGSWEALLERGQERFGVYCAVCHGTSGYGDGMVHQRALELMELGNAQWVPPTSLHDVTVLEREDGHIFNTITNGIRNMPAYGSQIPAEDRWAIVGYVRALQRSQRAEPADVPADMRDRLGPGGGS